MSTSGHHELSTSETQAMAHDLTTNPPPNDLTTLHSMDRETTPAMPVSVQEGTAEQTTTQISHDVPSIRAGPIRTDTTTAMMQAQAPPSPPPPMPSNPITRITSSAIGPSVDQPALPAKDEEEAGPKLQITLLLTNGARHPFILDNKYLAKRNVEAQDNDPYNLSVYKLKELILREWREEWEFKPTSPSYIRLISFGRLLDDKAPLKDQRFNPETQNVVHMTIKPQDFIEEDDGGKGVKASSYSHRDGADGRSPGCRCVVM